MGNSVMEVSPIRIASDGSWLYPGDRGYEYGSQQARHVHGQGNHTMGAGNYTMEGIVEAHYLKCPFCRKGRSDLYAHRCTVCGATAVAIVWKHDSPELALVARSYREP
jgi:hypothetical protein